MYEDDEMISDIEVDSIDEVKAKKILIKYLISASILLIILIISLINLSRIQMFGQVIGSFSGVFEGLGIALFYISLGLSFLFFAGMLIYILVMHLTGKEWRDIVILIDKKLDIVSFIFEVFAIILFIMIFLFTPCTIKGESMSPTFKTGQNIICTNYMAASPKKGDIIVFDARNENFPVDNVFYIKRVVATPGSEIRFVKANPDNPDTSYELFIDNVKEEVVDKYQMPRINKSLGYGDDIYEYTVPKGKYLVLGDNRGNSQDSRFFGFINKKQIFGKVSIRIFPFDKIKFF